jgi:hypothetical protein
VTAECASPQVQVECHSYVIISKRHVGKQLWDKMSDVSTTFCSIIFLSSKYLAVTIEIRAEIHADHRLKCTI